ncbi:MAG: translocation/assembly module TamB domain-containing protein [Cytophagales bacterium]|nr:translocation/assembly module TamB domain-containing protein [Cytophagales bacterium]
MTENRTRRIAKTLFKILLWTTGSVLALVLVLVVVLQFPSVQTRLTGMAADYLQGKIKTRVSVGGVNVAFPKKIVLEGVYVEDQQSDTLIYSRRLAADVSLWDLLDRRVTVHGVDLEGFTGHVNRTMPDSAFNFDFIVAAFSDSVAVAPADSNTGKPWQISVDDISLRDIYATYLDETTGQDAALRLGELDLSFEELDLNRAVYRVDELRIVRTYLTYVQHAQPNARPAVTQQAQIGEKPPQTPEAAFTTGLGKLALEDVRIRYQDHTAGQNLQADLGQCEMSADTLDVTRQVLAFGAISVKNTVIRYQQAAQPPSARQAKVAQPAPDSGQLAAPPWRVRLGELAFANNHLVYDDFNAPPQAAGMDFNHLVINNLRMNASDILYDGPRVLGNFEEISFREKSGFELRHFATQLRLGETLAEARDLAVQTGHSRLDGNVRFTFRSLETLARDYADAGLDIQLDTARLAARDLAYFQPNLLKTLPVRISENEVLNIEAAVRGQVKNLVIDRLRVSTFGNTRMVANGWVRGLPDIHRTRLQLAVLPFETSAFDIRALLPPSALPASVRIPTEMQLTATLSGAVHDLKLRSQLRTSLGNLRADARLATNRAFSDGSYSARLVADNLALGRLLRQEKDLGNLTATATVNGAGFDPKRMRAQLQAAVQSVTYRSYTYRNLVLDGLAHPSQFAANLSLADSNLNFTFVGSADFRKKTPNYVAVLDLKNADWKALNLTGRDLRTRAQLVADLNFTSIDTINGNLGLRNVAVASQGKMFTVDSLLYASIQEQGRTDITFESDILTGFFRGNIGWAGLAGALERHLNRYYELPNAAQTEASPQNFEFGLKLKSTDLLTEVLVPELDSLRPGEIRGSFDSRTNELDIRADVFSVKYGDIRVDSATLRLDSDPRRMRVSLSVERVRQGDIRLERTALEARASNNRVATALSVRDSTYRLKYMLGGGFESLGNQRYVFRFFTDSVRLNYEPWEVPATNAVQMARDGVRFNDLVFSQNGQSIALRNVNGQPSTFRAEFDKFRLETLGQILSRDTAFVSGLLNGYVNLFRQRKDSVFTADLRVDSLAYTGQPVGNVALAAQQRAGGRFDVSLGLTGNGNEMAVNGYYQTADAANALYFDADLRRLNLGSFAAFAKSQVSQLAGTATGRFSIRGSTARPVVNGGLTFQETLLNLRLLDSPFRIDNQTLRINETGIAFRDFTLLDSASRKLVVNGAVTLQDYTAFGLDLRVNTDRFQVLNTTAEDNNLYYGKLFATSDIRIRGTSAHPVVTASLKVDGNSELTYVVPQTDEAASGREGTVRFVDFGAEDDPFIRDMQQETRADTAKSTFSGYEFSANIEIDSNSVLRVVIDPTAGDQLVVKGQATLSLTLDPTGAIDLTGRYQVQQGTYNLSFYNLVQREFAIDRNSSITWAGNPYNAALDIRAIYSVETQSADLIRNQFSEQNLPAEARQRIPFFVILNLKGELLKPQISFALDMPREQQNILGRRVYAAVRDINTRESELNKQVFALFLLQRFIAEDPLASTGGGGIESTVRSSVSKILSEQLDRLAGQVQGVELDFDVNSFQDYSSGNARGRTQLELGLSKNLFSDRVVVKVTGNVDIEGTPAANQQQGISNFLGDLQLEYKLTQDGRLRLLGFRRRDFDIVNGELIETGAGVIFVRDYNSFRELFTKALEE